MTEIDPTELAALYRNVPTSTTGFTLCRQEERLMQYLRNHVPAILAQAARIERYEAELKGVCNFLEKAVERGMFSFDGEMLATEIASLARAALNQGTSDDD